jgi:hypothetical protein
MHFNNLIVSIFIILITATLFSDLISQDLYWDEPVRVSNNPKGWCGNPAICSDSDGKVYIAYRHHNSHERKKLYFTYYDGETWQEIDSLFKDLENDVYHTEIVCDRENNLHLSALINFLEINRIYYMKKNATGWSNPVQISVDSLHGASDYDMVIDENGKLHFIYNIGNVYYQTLNDSILSDPFKVTNLNLDYFRAMESRVSINKDGNLFITYIIRDESTDITEVYFQEFNGTEWSDPLNISQIEFFSGYDPDIITDSRNNHHIVWEQQYTKLDTVLGNPTMVWCRTILYTTRQKGVWSEPVNISDIPKSSSFKPKISIYKDNPLVFYPTEYEDSDGQITNYAYLRNGNWSITELDVDIRTTLHFDFCNNISDTIHFVSISSPFSAFSYTEYIRGFSNPTFLNDESKIFPKNLDVSVYPNPFNNSANFQIKVDRQDLYNIRVYDITGKLVKTILQNQILFKGIHLYNWNSKNDEGIPVSSGVYFLHTYRIDGASNNNKIILLR